MKEFLSKYYTVTVEIKWISQFSSAHYFYLDKPIERVSDTADMFKEVYRLMLQEAYFARKGDSYYRRMHLKIYSDQTVYFDSDVNRISDGRKGLVVKGADFNEIDKNVNELIFNVWRNFNCGWLIQEQDDSNPARPLLNRVKNSQKEDQSIDIDELTDHEILSICRGVDIPSIRKIGENYCANQKVSSGELTEAKEAIKSLLTKYNVVELLEYLRLPPLKTVYKGIRRIKRSLKGEDLSYEVLDHQKKKRIIVQKNDGSIVMKDEQGKEMISVNSNGKVRNATNRCIDLLLFEDVLSNPQERIKYYGVQTGRCSICKAELTDSRSILAGVGRTCAENYEIPY